MYSISLLLRMGSNFHRLIAAVDVVLADDGVVHVRREHPPPAAAVYASEIKDYVIRSYKKVMQGRRRVEVDGSSEEDDMVDGVVSESAPAAKRRKKRTNRGLDMLLRAWVAFFAVFNGLPCHGLAHFCIDAACCGGYNLHVTKHKMREAIIGLVYRCLPAIPEKGKWLCCGPCTDWFLVASTHGIIQHSWGAAFDAVTVDVSIAGASEQLDWHRLQGRRARDGGIFIRSPSMPMQLVIVCLAQEPLRWLTMWFLSRSGVKGRARAAASRRPPLARFREPCKVADWARPYVLRKLFAWRGMALGIDMGSRQLQFVRRMGS